MSVVLLDLGNTCAKACLYDADGFSKLHRQHYSENWAAALLAEFKRAAMDRVLLSNVRGAAAEAAIQSALSDAALPAAECARSTAQQAGVQCAYPQPERLGIDRWLAVIAAHHLSREAGFSGAAAVIDCGTAITVDAVTAEGQHLGGVIAPGIARMVASLAGATPGIPEQAFSFDALQPSWSNTTDAAVQQGALQAALGLIDRSRRVLQQQLPADTQYWLTGGSAESLQCALLDQWTLRPALVFDGLRYYFNLKL